MGYLKGGGESGSGMAVWHQILGSLEYQRCCTSEHQLANKTRRNIFRFLFQRGNSVTLLQMARVNGVRESNYGRSARNDEVCRKMLATVIKIKSMV